jgi:cysteinyl-tRNA synthetase
MAYRYWLLSAHYSTQVNFTLEAVKDAQNGLKKLVGALAVLADINNINFDTIKDTINSEEIDTEFYSKIIGIVSDDLSTPKAIAEIFKYVRDGHSDTKKQVLTILEIDKILGLNMQAEINAYIEAGKEIPAHIQELVTRREEARNNTDWKLSDELRDEIVSKGFELKDTESGQKITPKSM